ncbi:peptidylprolyl isomerase [Sphingomonas sp.]|uniref:peptidylprolyl isomerase n=1 Tax=Sphingomonas sp. TaxID=28214 RepID=UPI00286B60CA|nr:peptidylprolyl isomerase [Sphingomonas sp.]
MRIIRVISSKMMGWATKLAAGAAIAVAGNALAQQAGGDESQSPSGEINSTAGLKLPSNPELFGTTMPTEIKATAIINGDVITQTDIDQRLALLAISNGGQIPADQMQALRGQVLRNLIDETLQIQAAKGEDIKVSKDDIDKTVARVAGNVKQSPEQMATYLKSKGSSIRSIRRQIEGEIAWSRLQRAKIENNGSVGDDEVKAVIDRMTASKGTEEYRVGEIFLAAAPGRESAVRDNAGKILAALRQGGSFVGYARQYSESSSSAVGGDLGWMRPEMLPEPIAAAIRQMQPGAISNPIANSGGYSIVAVQDTRKILTADPRSAVLSLKQVSISFPKGMTRAQAEPTVQRFAQAVTSVGGCGGADKLATDFKGEIVSSDQVKLRDLPAALQEMMLPMQVGQATRPFGSIEEGVRTLVICGRDEASPSQPSFDQVYAQLNEERTNLRARRYLRDLRRDAIIDFR